MIDGPDCSEDYEEEDPVSVREQLVSELSIRKKRGGSKSKDLEQ